MMNKILSCIFFATISLVAAALNKSQAQASYELLPSQLDKMAAHPLVKLAGRRIADADVKKTIAANKLIKQHWESYQKKSANTLVSVEYGVNKLVINVFFGYQPKPYKPISNLTKPTETLPLGIQWGMTEDEFLKIAGTPLYVEKRRRADEHITLSYITPMPGNSKLFLSGNFYFMYNPGSEGGRHRLKEFGFSYWEKEVKPDFTNTSIIDGRKYAEAMLKQYNETSSQRTTKSLAQLVIPDSTLFAYTQKGFSQGFMLEKTFYPDFTKLQPSQTASLEFRGAPGYDNLFAVLTKDSFAAAANSGITAKIYDEDGGLLATEQGKFKKLVFDKQFKFYRTSYSISIPVLPAGAKCQFILSYYDPGNTNRPVYIQFFAKRTANPVVIKSKRQRNTQPVNPVNPSPPPNTGATTALQFAQQYKDSYTQQQGYYYTKLSPATTNNMGYQTFSGCEQPGYELTVNFFVEQKYNLSIEVSKSCVGQPTRTVSSPTFSLVSVINGIKIYTDKFGRWSEQGACSQCNYYFRVKTNSPTMTEVPMVTTTTKLQK